MTESGPGGLPAAYCAAVRCAARPGSWLQRCGVSGPDCWEASVRSAAAGIAQACGMAAPEPAGRTELEMLAGYEAAFARRRRLSAGQAAAVVERQFLAGARCGARLRKGAPVRREALLAGWDASPEPAGDVGQLTAVAAGHAALTLAAAAGCERRLHEELGRVPLGATGAAPPLGVPAEAARQAAARAIDVAGMPPSVLLDVAAAAGAAGVLTESQLSGLIRLRRPRLARLAFSLPPGR